MSSDLCSLPDAVCSRIDNNLCVMFFVSCRCSLRSALHPPSHHMSKARPSETRGSQARFLSRISVAHVDFSPPIRSLPPLASRKEASTFFEISQSRGRRARRTSSCRSSRPPATRQGRVLPHSFAAARQRARNPERLETSPRRCATPPSSGT